MTDSLNGIEKIVYTLGKLYSRYGYRRFKMGKFEEYDIYAHNKDFLISDHVITFTDTNGKLMALKPDVTLSIVKNTAKEPLSFVNKVYYNENVYRISGSAKTFKEIKQTGLECIGCLTDYDVFEVLSLAKESLNAISNNYILDVSNMGFLNAVFCSLNLSEDAKTNLLLAFKDKNSAYALSILNNDNIDQKNIDRILALIKMNETVQNALDILSSKFPEKQFKEYIAELKNVLLPLNDNRVKIDFSAINDMRYYNGIVFRGYIDNVPKAVLSGGRYDKLMQKMGKVNSAIGFAVYPDELNVDETSKFDADVLIITNNELSVTEVKKVVDEYVNKGLSVNVQPRFPEGMNFGEIIDLRRV